MRKSYDKTKTIPTNFNKKKATSQAQNIYQKLEFSQKYRQKKPGIVLFQ